VSQAGFTPCLTVTPLRPKKKGNDYGFVGIYIGLAYSHSLNFKRRAIAGAKSLVTK
jgi:hypothetical protein